MSGKSKPGTPKQRGNNRKAKKGSAAAAIGNNGRLLARVREIIEQTPEVRPEKVALLQKAIENGTYRVDARKLADILIKKSLLEP